jgi:RNA-directed DNA polymerase
MDGKKLFPTLEGTPQGGCISPLLANIALHGMENLVKKMAESFDMRCPSGKSLGKRDKKSSIALIRYADDFVILHENIDNLQWVKTEIEEWLKDIGLELKPSKTRTAHTLKVFRNEKPGFDFLGFNIKQHKTGKYTCARSIRGLLGFKTITTPSKQNQKLHYKKVAEVIEKHKGVSQTILIGKLNPIIRGWCNYYSAVISKEVFSRLDHLITWKLLKWGIKRHRKKGKKWIKEKYFKSIGGRNWVFANRINNNPLCLIKYSDTKIVRYTKVKGNASPYNGNLIYWSTRMGRNPEMPMRTAIMLKQQKGKCSYCELIFQENDVIETDHIIPTAAGGKDEYKNLQLLHRHCHDNKTKSDLKIIKDYQRKKRVEEFYKWFNKLNWIWKEDIPTMV